MSMNNYLGDELAYKVKVLSLALYDADKIIHTLEEENETLKNILNNLTSTIKSQDIINQQQPICA
jgi:hypothetical protein